MLMKSDVSKVAMDVALKKNTIRYLRTKLEHLQKQTL
jgi:hypothetical protein